MNVVETENIEMLQLMNTSTAHNININQTDASLASVSTATVSQTGNIFHLVVSAFVLQ